jgi:hypothetical protein
MFKLFYVSRSPGIPMCRKTGLKPAVSPSGKKTKTIWYQAWKYFSITGKLCLEIYNKNVFNFLKKECGIVLP